MKKEVYVDKIVRRRSNTDPTLGSVPSERPVEKLIQRGIVCIHKSRGPTTHQVSQKVKEILGVSKVGHAGQLEPIMTGVVVVLLEESCKLTSLFTKQDRQYMVRLQFSTNVDKSRLEFGLRKFTGKIRQVPPIRSRVRRVLRSRMVYEMRLEEFRGRQAKVYVHCEAGTYIRKLFYEMTRILRTNISIPQIERLAIGDLDTQKAVSISEFQRRVQAYRKGKEEALREVVLAVDDWVQEKELIVEDGIIPKLCCGAPLYLDKICAYDEDIESGSTVLVRSLKGEVVCLAKMAVSSEEMSQSETSDLFVAHPVRIFMPPKTYWVDNHYVC